MASCTTLLWIKKILAVTVAGYGGLRENLSSISEKEARMNENTSHQTCFRIFFGNKINDPREN